jgi:hypothetical protein
MKNVKPHPIAIALTLAFPLAALPALADGSTSTPSS